MLSEELVNRVALITSIAGIAMLLLLDAAFSPEKTAIAEINEGKVKGNVLVEGKVEWKTEKEGFVIFGLNDGNSINAIIFSPTQEQKEILQQNSFIQVEGKVQLYRNEPEIVASRVRKVG